MTDFLDEDWDRAPAEKPLAAVDHAGRGNRRLEHALEFLLAAILYAVLIPVLIGCLHVCWRFWSHVVLWCLGLGRRLLENPNPALPWLLAAFFAVLSLRSRRSGS